MPYGAAEPSTDKRDRHIGDMLLRLRELQDGAYGVNFLTWFLLLLFVPFTLLYFATTDRPIFFEKSS